MKNEVNKVFSIGSRIRLAREESGYSQLDLAKTLGFESATAISLIENDERNIAVTNLEKIADFLHKDIKFFLGKEEDKIVSVEFALRADKNLSKEAKDAISHFIELAKKKGNGK